MGGWASLFSGLSRRIPDSVTQRAVAAYFTGETPPPSVKEPTTPKSFRLLKNVHSICSKSAGHAIWCNILSIVMQILIFCRLSYIYGRWSRLQTQYNWQAGFYFKKISQFYTCTIDSFSFQLRPGQRLGCEDITVVRRLLSGPP